MTQATTSVPTNPELEDDRAEYEPVEAGDEQNAEDPAAEGDRLATLEQHDAEARRIANRIITLRHNHGAAKSDASAAKKALDAAYETLADHALQKLTFGPLFDADAAEEDKWRGVSVDELVDHGATTQQIGKLTGKAPPIRTLGDLSTFLSDEHTRLGDIDGIGTKGAEAIEDALGAWFADNPEMCPPVKLAVGEIALLGVEDDDDDEDAQAEEA